MQRNEKDPIARFKRWFDQARRAGAPIVESMALATVGPDNRPSVRYVLLKEVGRDGFVFYTDVRSRKGRELLANPYASLAFYWDETGHQVRIDGTVSEVSPPEADAYWRTRPRQSRLAASASTQSAKLGSRGNLTARVEALREKFRGRDVPRPDYWKGFRLRPEAIEFWTRRVHRLHERELFVRRRSGWKLILLQP